MLTQNKLTPNIPGQLSYLPSLKETLTFLSLFAAIVFLFYINDIMAIKYIAMLIFSALAFASRRKLIWVVILFVIVDRTGGLFTEQTLETAMVGLPLLTVGSGLSLSFKDLLLLALIFSALLRNRIKLNRADHYVILGLISFYLLVGWFLYGTSLEMTLIIVLRGYLFLLLFFIMKSDFTVNDLFKFLHLISLLLVFVLADQIFAVVTGQRLLAMFMELDLGVSQNTLTLEARVSPFGINTVIFSFMYGLMLLSVHKRYNYKLASNTYAAFLVVTSLFSILISQTRGAIGVFAVILLFSAPYLIVRFRNIAITLGIFFLMVNILGLFGLNWDYFYRNTFARVMTTVSPIITGSEFTELGTGGRDSETIQILQHVKASPFVGYGSGSETRGIYNNNLGGVNALAQFGAMGFLVLILALLKWYSDLLRVKRRIPKDTLYYAMGHVVFAVLMGMMLGFLTSFNYFTSTNYRDIIRLVIIMAMSSFVFDYYKAQKHTERKPSPAVYRATKSLV